ncbi:MAG: CoA-binding protein, partial [Bacteroidota bacterium]|nr:CoA-binding protein [Bacteroidota bacterium]
MTKTLVFGVSTNPGRYSNMAVRRLVDQRIETAAFGIHGGTVSGVQIKDNLVDFQNIDTVTLYLNPSRQKQYYKKIVDLRPKRVIFNPGTENPEFYEILEKEGI